MSAINQITAIHHAQIAMTLSAISIIFAVVSLVLIIYNQNRE